jgi:putative MATE family efflux protein
MVTIGLFYVADAAFISRLGTAELAAVSVAFPIFAVVGGIGQAFGAGAASWISRLLGAGDRETAGGAASVAVFGAAGAGILVATTGQLVLPALLRLLGAPATVFPHALAYTRIIVPANAVTILNVTMAGIVRSEGNARLAMYSVIVSQTVNIVLDPLLIFGARLGIRGAALATAAAQTASCVLLLMSIIRRRNHCAVTPRLAARYVRLLPRVVAVGLPSWALQLLGSFALAIINRATSEYGEAALGSVGIAFRVLALGAYPVYGLSLGFQPIAGYSHGAGRYDRLLSALKVTAALAGAYSLVFAAGVVGLAPHIVTVVGGDQAVTEIGTKILRAVTVCFPLFSMQIVFAVLFQSIGRAGPAALIFAARQAFFFLPAVLILPRIMGLDGIILSQPIADILTFALTAYLGIRALRELTQQSRPSRSPVAAQRDGTDSVRTNR